MKTLLRSGEIKFYFYFFPALSICRSRKAREKVIKRSGLKSMVVLVMGMGSISPPLTSL
jgi:hypothetical protein